MLSVHCRAIKTLAVTWAASFAIVLVACGDEDRPPTLSTSSSSSSASSSSGGRVVDGAVDGTSSSSSSGDSGVDASNDGSSGGPACADVGRDGPDVAEVRVAQNPPAAAGGTIAPGKYLLTTWETYAGTAGMAGPTGSIRKSTLLVSATQLTFATRDVEEAADLPVRIETFQPKGTTLESQETCPLEGRTFARKFTASANELVLFEPFGAITRRLVYKMQ